MFNDSNVAASKNKKLGIKIVNNPYNKRESDPFNTKNVIKPRSSSMTYEDKLFLVEKQQSEIDSKIKQMAPFHNGVKNENFAPVHQKFVAVVGDKEKFDQIYNYENEGNLGSEVKEKKKNFQKLSGSSSNVCSSESKGNCNHNWWANKLDETKQQEILEKEQKKNQKSDKQEYHPKKKIDFEENVSNNRSYLEEFNIRNNRLHKEMIDKKVQQRVQVSNHVLNKVVQMNNNDAKDILQNKNKGDIISEENVLSKDYRKERAMARSQAIENIKNKMNLGEGKKDVDTYYQMNNRLINDNLNVVASKNKN